MSLKRRNFLQLSALSAGAVFSSAFVPAAGESPKSFSSAPAVEPISLAERQARIAKAQKLLVENNIGALILDSGTGLTYFTGLHWGGSERTMVAIIPAKGEVSYVCPAFEEARLREHISIGKEVAVWQEDESPYALIVSVLQKNGIRSGAIAFEERARFFIVNGVQLAAPQYKIVSGDPITIPCRLIKSAAEIALMQRATDITVAAIKTGVDQLKEGMTQRDLARIIMQAQNQGGGNADFALCLFGESSSFPHGSSKPQTLKKGDIVLMDCGCLVEGYNSDVTRTVVFGEPTKKQEEVWLLEKKAQAAAFAACTLGATCDSVDAAARKVIVAAGYGPGYKTPGLPHRTGHGIGMDGHEWGNIVKGNKLVLQPGMCFSIEPTIAIPGEFGVRFEDCVYMTEAGPKWFSQPSKSLAEPFAA